MKLSDRTIVITGAASGIGHALALRFAGEAPRGLVLADLPQQGAALQALAESISGKAPGGVPAIAVPAKRGHRIG